MAIGQFLAGLALLLVGAEWLVRGSARVASLLGVSRLMIGLTFVALGTSAPEMAVGVASAWKGEVEIALGNVVGSNIMNVLVILGMSALIAPVTVHRQLIRLDVPIMVGISVLALLMGLDGIVGRWDGILLALGLALYIGFTVWKGKSEPDVEEDIGVALPARLPTRLPLYLFQQFLFVAAGLALLVLGSDWLVGGATTIARALGVSNLIIGLTIVAGGTSLPEAATSIVAALRGERDLAVGNVVGSNIFNLLGVLGVSAAVAPAGLPVPQAMLVFDLPVMIAVAVVCLPIFFSGQRVDRLEGGLFLLYFGLYMAYVVFRAVRPQPPELFVNLVVWVVVPFTVVVLAYSALHARRQRRRATDPPAP